MYYFEAYKEWKLDDSLFSLFGNSEKYRFPCIEFSLNSNFFLLDTVTKCDDMMLFQHYMFGSIKDVLNFIAHEDILESTISILSPRYNNDGDYVTSDIKEVIQAKDPYNQTAYIYCCKNKKKYIDSAMGSKEAELSQLKTIYKQNLQLFYFKQQNMQVQYLHQC